MKQKLITRILALAVATVMVTTPVSVEAAQIPATEETLEELGQVETELVEVENMEENVSANEVSGQILQTEQVFSESGIKGFRKPSKTEVRNELIDIFSKDYNHYSIEPSYTYPYVAGKMDPEHANATMRFANLLRNISGAESYRYSENLMNAMQHYVVCNLIQSSQGIYDKPSEMSDDFYNKALLGANADRGTATMSRMDSPDATKLFLWLIRGNISSNGYFRKTITDVKYNEIGFGYAHYTEILDWWGPMETDRLSYGVNTSDNYVVPDYDFMSWPASGTFPMELAGVDSEWVITLNEELFDLYLSDAISVTITGPDGRMQIITDEVEVFYDDITFTLGTSVFDTTQEGTYTITVRGLNTVDGAPAVISYSTELYSALGDIAPTETTIPDDAKVTSFVERLYKLCFNRSADDEGMVTWKSALVRKEKSGAEVAWGFFFSQEMKNRNLSDAQFVELLYKVMMNRASDAGGKKYWLNCMQSGMSREGVFKGFAESAEFNNVCNSYGILRGNVTVSQGRDRNAGLTMFVSRLYTKALGRNYDVNGLNDWCSRISDGTWSVTDVSTTGFFNSPEFLNKNLSNQEYVKVLYQTFFDRKYDQNGYEYWLKKLNSGEMNRNQVLQGFSNSQEFHNLMKSYGL